ncbi:MAG: sugar phosphate nucleotidyltransferase [Methanocorpusculum sp.]|nr:sugar phosphate nucleotidyltransferase [Methanocorpusculum sp.]
MSPVQALILAGGEGTRLRPLTKNRPKVLLPVGNKPILGYVLDAVVKAGIRDITVVVGYQKEQVMKFLNTYPLDVNVVIQPKQLGSYDAMVCGAKNIHGDAIVLSGDNYIDAASLSALLEHKNSILAAPHQRPWEYGVVFQQDMHLLDIKDAAEHVTPGSLVSCGMYYFEKEYLDFIVQNGIHAIMHEFRTGRYAAGVVVANDWRDASNPRDLIALNAHVLERQATSIRGIIDKGAKIRGHVVIGKNTKIGPGAVITGPVIIGDDCIIGPNVCIGEGTSLGDRVKIEPFTYLKNSIIMNDCHIGAQSRITDSVLGDGCILHQTATTTVDGVGAVVGDRATINAFTILRGAVVGNNVTIDGGRLIEKEIPDNTRVM